MADTKSDSVAQSTVEAPTAGGEGKEYVLPSWANGSNQPAPIVDDENDHSVVNSAIGGLNVTSSIAPLRPSTYGHVTENGRTYHRFRSGKYMLPNDQQEQERLDIQHSLFVLSLGSLYLAPIGPNPKNVLDIATGTGLWAIEFASQYPSALVLGTDLSAIQPTQLPPNCRFKIEDAEDQWMLDKPFDYIHGRMLLSCFKDPRSVFQKAYDALTPGGYFEMQDMDFPFKFMGDPPIDSPFPKWGDILCEASAKLGRPWTNVPKYKGWFEEMGFEDVVEKIYYWPLNTWAEGEYYKQLSVYAQADLLNGLDGLSLKLMGLVGWSADEVKEFLVGVKSDIKNTDIHSYSVMRVIYGRKPGVKL